MLLPLSDTCLQRRYRLRAYSFVLNICFKPWFKPWSQYKYDTLWLGLKNYPVYSSLNSEICSIHLDFTQSKKRTTLPRRCGLSSRISSSKLGLKGYITKCIFMVLRHANINPTIDLPQSLWANLLSTNIVFHLAWEVAVCYLAECSQFNVIIAINRLQRWWK